MQFHIQGAAHKPIHGLRTLIQRFFKIPNAQLRKQLMKLIKTKKITSKSDRLLHSNTPAKNLVHELLTSLKTPGQAICESYLPTGQAGIQIFFEPQGRNGNSEILKGAWKSF